MNRLVGGPDLRRFLWITPVLLWAAYLILVASSENPDMAVIALILFTPGYVPIAYFPVLLNLWDDEAKAMGKVRRVFLVPTAVCWVSILVGFGALASGVQRLIGIVAVIAAAAYVSSVIGAVIAGRASRRAGPAT